MTLRKTLQIITISTLFAVAGVIDVSAHSTGTPGSGMTGNIGGSAHMPGPGIMNQGHMPMADQYNMPMNSQHGFSIMRGMMMDGGHMRGDRPYSSDEIKRIIDGKLALQGLTRLKVGDVKESKEGAFDVDILTLDDSLAAKLTIDRQTGHISAVE